MIFRSLFVCLLLLSSLAAQTAATAPAKNPATTSTAQAPPSAKIDPAKEADIRRLLKLVKVDALALQMMDSMTVNVRPIITNSFPPGQYREKLVDLFFEKFRSKANPNDLIEMAVPLYDKYFTDEEIKGLIKFYETPVGQKAIATLPQLTAALQENGRAWGERLGRESMVEVMAEHPELADQMKAAALQNKMQ